MGWGYCAVTFYCFLAANCAHTQDYTEREQQRILDNTIIIRLKVVLQVNRPVAAPVYEVTIDYSARLLVCFICRVFSHGCELLVQKMRVNSLYVLVYIMSRRNLSKVVFKTVSKKETNILLNELAVDSKMVRNNSVRI